jgi:uncharacterized metal-binding protein YceD (DUF177 family)
MARKPPPKSSKRSRPTAEEASAARKLAPPPSGLPLMPRPFNVEDIRDDGKSTLEIEASEAERIALAQAYGLPAIAALKARYFLVKRGKCVFVTGEIRTVLTQVCVVTLEPFESEIVEPVEIEYAPESFVAEAWERLAAAEAANPNAPVQEPPDVIVDGKIDLGALTAEALALALDPYPKKPGVAFVDVMPPEDMSESPFAALARLKGEGGPEGGKG